MAILKNLKVLNLRQISGPASFLFFLFFLPFLCQTFNRSPEGPIVPLHFPNFAAIDKTKFPACLC